eukprot:1194328-Pyramimonas_sp.AAC.1
MGEPQALEWTVRFTTGPVVYVTDCAEVARGWYVAAFDCPQGPQADLWRSIGLTLSVQGRRP